MGGERGGERDGEVAGGRHKRELREERRRKVLI